MKTTQYCILLLDQKCSLFPIFLNCFHKNLKEKKHLYSIEIKGNVGRNWVFQKGFFFKKFWNSWTTKPPSITTTSKIKTFNVLFYFILFTYLFIFLGVGVAKRIFFYRLHIIAVFILDSVMLVIFLLFWCSWCSLK